MRRQRTAPPVERPTPPPDPWIALIAAPDRPVTMPRRTPVTTADIVRIDDIVRAVGRLTDAHGRAVRLVALRHRPKAATEVVVGAPVTPPAGWARRGDDACGLLVPADDVVTMPADPRREAPPPVLVAFDAPDDATVVSDLAALRALVVPSTTLVAFAEAIVRTPLAPGLDVVLHSVAPGRLRPAPAPVAARLHVTTDVDDLRALVRALAGDVEPVVVVAAGASRRVIDELRALDATVVTDTPCRPPAATIAASAATTGGWRLDPPGWPVEAIRPA